MSQVLRWIAERAVCRINFAIGCVNVTCRESAGECEHISLLLHAYLRSPPSPCRVSWWWWCVCSHILVEAEQGRKHSISFTFILWKFSKLHKIEHVLFFLYLLMVLHCVYSHVCRLQLPESTHKNTSVSCTVGHVSLFFIITNVDEVLYIIPAL